MDQYIWQKKAWQDGSAPQFRWQTGTIDRQIRRLQLSLADFPSRDTGLIPDAQMQLHIDALVQTALRSSEIEGEVLDARSVRSSVVKKLGLENAGAPEMATPQTDALAELLVTATSNLNQPITQTMLGEWQAALFANPNPLLTINIGQLRGNEPMQVLSGRIDRPRVHFEAPPRGILESELTRFLQWFNHPPENLNGYIRAAITHLWFITLHPFDDGNGRVTRALADRALAQAENSTIRFYSHSAAIMARRGEYYELLEATQKGSLEISEWLHWFITTLTDAITLSKKRYDAVLYKARFWQRHAQTVLNSRQIKVLNRLLDHHGEEFNDGINATKYRSIGKVSKATATRELTDLVNKSCLTKLPGGGRSTRYSLPDLQPE